MLEVANMIDTSPDQKEAEVKKRRQIVEKIIITALAKGMDSPAAISSLAASTLDSLVSLEYVRWVIYDLKSQGVIEFTSGFNIVLTEKSEDYLGSDSTESVDIEELVDATMAAERTKRLIGGKLIELINSLVPVTETSNLEP